MRAGKTLRSPAFSLANGWIPASAIHVGDSASNQSAEQEATRNFLMEDLWTPSIQGANTISFKTFQYSLEADRNGRVTYWERFDGVFSNDFQLARFPFDTQVLRFEFQPFLSSASHIHFADQALPPPESVPSNIPNSPPGTCRNFGTRPRSCPAIV